MIWNESFHFDNKSMDVLLVGEILMDLIHDPDTGVDTPVVGGSPYNISKSLTKMGIRNRFYGAVGNDAYATAILDDIKANKIDADVSSNKAMTSFVKINRTVSSPYPIFFRNADKLIHPTPRLISDVSHSKILHFTYWPLSTEPSRKTLLTLIDKAKASQTLVCFDPNYHPSLDDFDGQGLETIRDIIQKVDIIKPSLDDSIRMFGHKPLDEYLDIYQNLGAKLIIMTLGKDGLVARYQKETLQLPSMARHIIDSTGAGDAFWSGLYAGLTQGLTVRESLYVGLTCSALNLQNVGADFPLPDYQTLFSSLGR